MSPREQIEALELAAEEMFLNGEGTPSVVGVRCNDCGVEILVPWADRAELVDRMAGHQCPRPK